MASRCFEPISLTRRGPLGGATVLPLQSGSRGHCPSHRPSHRRQPDPARYTHNVLNHHRWDNNIPTRYANNTPTPRPSRSSPIRIAPSPNKPSLTPHPLPPLPPPLPYPRCREILGASVHPLRPGSPKHVRSSCPVSFVSLRSGDERVFLRHDPVRP